VALSLLVPEAPMATPDPFPSDAPSRIPALLRQVTDARAYRRLLCVKLALDGQPAEQIAAALGWHPTSVRRVWARYRAEGEATLLGRPCGGRRHAYLTPDGEDALLAPFLAAAEAGGVLVAAPIKAAYEARVGKAVPKSTVYRLLARHGWRKVAPRRRHPEQDDAVRAAFTGGSLSWWWRKSPSRRPPGTTAAPSA